MTSKTVKNIREPLKKPRPLKSASVESPKDTLNTKARADLLAELEILNVRIGNCDFDEIVTGDIAQMCCLLKKHGEELDTVHKDALDRFFSTLRNICREDRLDAVSRLKLLEVIEMRAMRWRTNENVTNYFTSKFSQLEETNERQLSGSISPNTLLNSQSQNFSNIALAPGEVLRSSGKFSKPTKIAGKNYFKDEIVIRNCDSGKVMGIKGRRVHMIEELSDTVISFQRVNAGARDRLVQITGPHEEAISHAKYLVEDTIKRNVSPVRDNLNISDLNIDNNKDSVDYGTSYFDRNATSKRNLSHSYSMSDATSRDSSVHVYIGNEVIMLSGGKPELLKTASRVLTEYFTFHLEPLEKEVFHPSKSSSNNNQRFALKKQASLKDNLPASFAPVNQSFSRQSSSSMSSSSDEVLPDEESPELEALVSAPIPPPSYPSPLVYSREFLIECARSSNSQKKPPNYDHIAACFPEIIPQSPVMLDPSQILQRQL